MTDVCLELDIHAILDDAEGVRVFDLRRADGGELPAFTAGAHVDVVLDGGIVRQYSLCNAPGERHRYLIAVALDEPGRGGSRHLHMRVAEGDRLRVGVPRNHFELAPAPAPSVLVAGGIGVTPLWAMAQALEAAGRPWELHYGVRTRAAAPLLERIEAFAAHARHGRLALYRSREGECRRVDLAALMGAVPAGAHVYACGSPSMLEDYLAAGRAAGVSPERLHLERFQAVAEAASEGGFSLVLARSQRVIEVAAGQTILDALEAGGVRVRYTCREGICGDCETAVIEGEPEHRDAVLSDAERAANATMMICCSGSRSPRLVLDL